MAVRQDGGVSVREDVPAEGLDLAKISLKRLKNPSPLGEGFNPTSLLPWLERERLSISSADDRPCHHSSLFPHLEQCECSTGCTRFDVPVVEQLQVLLSYPLTSLPRFGSPLKPIHSGLTVIRLMAAFGLSAGQQQLARCDGLNLSFAAIQSKKNWRLALAAMYAEIPPRVGRFG